MAKTPEAKVKDKIKAYLKSIGAVYAMPIGGPYSTAGIEDFIACYRGRYIGIEAKAPGKRIIAGSNQDDRRKEITAAGGSHIEADDVEIVKAAFKDLFGL